MAKIPLVARDIFEKGPEGAGDEFLDRRRLGAFLMQARPDAQRAFVLDGLEHFFLRFEVVVEGARGQRRRPDDVANGGGTIAELGKDRACRLQNGLAVLRFGHLALAARFWGRGGVAEVRVHRVVLPSIRGVANSTES
jgi:hypothetical protein